MSWTKKQKMTMVVACRDAGMLAEHRKLVLQQFPHALHQGRYTSTAPRLTNTDFEQAMAVVERTARGTIPGFSRGYWERKAADGMERPRRLAAGLAQQLAARGHLQLPGFIARMTSGTKSALDQLDHRELYKLIEAMKNIAFQHHMEIRS